MHTNESLSLTDSMDLCNTVSMSNTPTNPQPTCLRCDLAAHYVIGTSDAHGPESVFTASWSGKYCYAHGKERAAELLPAWETRQAEKLAQSTASHAAWKASSDAARSSK